MILNRIYFYLTILIIIGGIQEIFSQEINKSTLIEISQIESSITNQNIVSKPTSDVKITQVGNKNRAEVISFAQGVKMNVLQLGNENYIFSKVSIQDYRLNAVQRGGNLNFFNNPIFSETGTQLEVIQEGNNQHVENNGANAISKNMRIRITGSDRTLIIQNIQ